MSRDDDRPGRLRRMLGVVLANVAIFVGLLLLLNLVSGVAGRLYLATRTAGDAGATGQTEADSRIATAQAEAGSTRIEYAPYVAWRRLPFGGDEVTVGADGDRVTPPSSGVDADRRPVRFFGGSAMWGVGAPDDGTIPAYYQRLADGVGVLNHGEMAFNTRQNLERLINVFAADEPLAGVVFYEGVNDVLTLCRRDISLNGHNEEPEMRRQLHDAADVASFFDRIFLAETRALLGRVIRKLEGGDLELDLYLCADDDDRARSVAETVFRNLDMAHGLVAGHEAWFLAALQPVAYVGDSDTSAIDGELERFREWGRQYDAVYPLMQKLCREREWCHDLTDVFDDHGHVYLDFVHVRPEGNELVARRLLELAPEN